MGFTDWLKGVLPKNLQLKAFNRIRILNNSRFANKTYIDNLVLNINLYQLPPGQKKDVLQSISKPFESGMPILENNYISKIEDYVENIKGTENKDILAYYSDKLPAADILILKASIYLKSVLKRGGDTLPIKKDIVQRFGTRGRNISNLYSAGYFDNQIKDIYEQMQKEEGFDKQKFLKIYEYIVQSYPFAIFISRDMSRPDTLKSIKTKVESNKKYGFHYLNIHGIGSENIHKIEYSIEQLEKEIKLTSKKITTEGSIIAVRIEF
jgi:hypothetical protein